MKNRSKLFFCSHFNNGIRHVKKLLNLPHYANGTAPTFNLLNYNYCSGAADSSKTVLTLILGQS